MTQYRCAWCGRPMGEGAPTGRPAKYCRRSCRQRAYEARRAGRDRDQLEDLLRRTRRELDQLLDDRSVLRATLTDLELDGDETPEVLSLIGSLHRMLGLPEPPGSALPQLPRNAGNPRSVK